MPWYQLQKVVEDKGSTTAPSEQMRRVSTFWAPDEHRAMTIVDTTVRKDPSWGNRDALGRSFQVFEVDDLKSETTLEYPSRV